MSQELNYISNITELVQMGGLPIAAILSLSLLIFFLFFERLYFLCISFKRSLPAIVAHESKFETMSAWEKHRIQDALIAEALTSSQKSFWLLKAAIVSCPLIGLMGTVSGMILVFDQISLTGTGNPRMMASGIFHATLPTMAGMMVSIIGLIMQYILRRVNFYSQTLLSQHLPSSNEHMEGAI